MEQRPDRPATNRDEESPVPPDASVETPQADPRTEGAPDGPEPRSTPDRPDPFDSPQRRDRPDTTEEDIQEAFE
ncbi:MAG TPA: hypothetical protein VGR41_08355 [Actinomycetota bacterium]|nr:hypothetical protein [Actinomycetota bacterium]